jgi:hypothetical protein
MERELTVAQSTYIREEVLAQEYCKGHLRLALLINCRGYYCGANKARVGSIYLRRYWTHQVVRIVAHATRIDGFELPPHR